MEKAICLNCKKKVDYDVKTIKAKAIIKGEKVEYGKKTAICKDCGKEVWVEELDDFNATEAIEQYCRNHNLIIISEIENIMEKYRIGKKHWPNF